MAENTSLKLEIDDSEELEEKENSTTLEQKTEENEVDDGDILKNPVANPIWLSVSEAAKISGVNAKTIRRAIQAGNIRYRIYKNRYLIGLRSLIKFLHTNKKLENKLKFNGIGQYIKGWRK